MKLAEVIRQLIAIGFSVEINADGEFSATAPDGQTIGYSSIICHYPEDELVTIDMIRFLSKHIGYPIQCVT